MAKNLKTKLLMKVIYDKNENGNDCKIIPTNFATPLKQTLEHRVQTSLNIVIIVNLSDRCDQNDQVDQNYQENQDDHPDHDKNDHDKLISL